VIPYTRTITIVGLNFENLKSEPAACQRVSYLFCPNQKAPFLSKLRPPKIRPPRFSESRDYLLSTAAHLFVFWLGMKKGALRILMYLCIAQIDDAAVDVN
jgi:hypothetical protein